MSAPLTPRDHLTEWTALALAAARYLHLPRALTVTAGLLAGAGLVAWVAVRELDVVGCDGGVE